MLASPEYSPQRARLAWSWTPGLLVVAIAVAAIGAAIAADLGALRTFIAAYYIAVLAAAVAFDLNSLRVPNSLVLPALFGAVLLSFALGGDALQPLAGGLVAFVVLLVVAILGRGAMGGGDVKVGALCGMAVGLNAVLTLLALTFVAGGAVAAVVLLLGLRKRKDVVAFTPFLAAATLACLFAIPNYLLG
jgi:prepilin signal peptidase PulO-like enzyme (type II secretory pathway)